MTREEKMKMWVDHKRKMAKQNGEEFFLGTPDNWYEDITYGCINGHISHSYIKSEALGYNACGCKEPVWIIPPGTTEQDLADILK